MATQIMQAMGPTMEMKPPPSLPSPTLTNPDMVLPNEPLPYPPLPSPPRYARRDRPPSPGYLRDQTVDTSRSRSTSSASTIMVAKKEKRGLVSRKMMLLRSRTASNGTQVNGSNPIPRSSPSDYTPDDYGLAYASSPTLMDVGNLAPEQPSQNRFSISSVGSVDMTTLPQFLAKYEIRDGVGTDDELDGELPAPSQNGYSESIEGGLEEHRRQQEEDEYNSAILSNRAEQILANAKKRLNLMEGNLRGARDLVTPLTAANLKRATSVGSSYGSAGAGYRNRARYVHHGYNAESPGQHSYHKLVAQASSPTIGQDYFQGHSRGFSETEVPERPRTALERSFSPIVAQGRIPTKASDSSGTSILRGSRSHDSIGNGAFQRRGSRDQARSRGSPDSNLEPLVEDDGYYHAVSTSRASSLSEQDGLGIYRSPSRTEDLREQMSSLKGKISSLKERAREDSLRRQSMSNLREPSPLNNAADAAPEFFYTSSPAYKSPVLDTNAGVGRSSQNDSPITPQIMQKALEPDQVLTGSRNAFATQAQTVQQLEIESDGSSSKSQQQAKRPKVSEWEERPVYSHKRTPSGTAIVQSSRHWLSHHQQSHSREIPSNPVEGCGSHESHTEKQHATTKSARHGHIPGAFDDYAESESEDSVYEDAQTAKPATEVAHEDRADAFDYETFFLHSAISTYGVDDRRGSISSDEDTVTSTETARGPTTAGAGEEDEEPEDYLYDINGYPPPSPKTPERLREIERKLHQRTLSNESVSTVATFATATEGRESPVAASNRVSVLDWPIRSAEDNSQSKPIVLSKHPSPVALSDSSSESADSGIGLAPRSHSSQSSKSPALKSVAGPKSALSHTMGTSSSTLSPPMSPRTMVDPTTVAVNALVGSGARQLGLKDKALLFGLVESLSKVCHQLQEGAEGGCDSRALRIRLDDARRALNGTAARSGSI